MSVGTELQTAMYAALSTPLAAGLVGLYDEAPELPIGMPDTSFPYVVIGEMDFTPWDADDIIGYEVYTSLHIWSRYRGKKELHDAFEICKDALNRQTLSLASWRVFDILQFGGFATTREGDNTTMHGFGRFVFKLTAS